jgi:hypothetical protein
MHRERQPDGGPAIERSKASTTSPYHSHPSAVPRRVGDMHVGEIFLHKSVGSKIGAAARIFAALLPANG